MQLLHDLMGSGEAGKRLCLLPISRVLAEEPAWLSEGVAIFPPESLAPQALRVVSWPSREMQEMLRRGGGDLHWGKSAATGIDLPEFFGSALLGFHVRMDWKAFLRPSSHEAHLDMLAAAMAEVESVLDVVRFEMCNPWLPQTLPGRAGLLNDSGFCAGLFYSAEDHESYIIAGQVATHQLICGIGLDLSGVTVEPVGSGEVGSIVRHGLRLYSEAMEAATETSRFVQMLSLIEFLADPGEFTKMATAKRLIARHAARDRAEYDAILEDFRYLTSEGKTADGANRGLRHNIVHCGQRLEDLATPEERKAIFRRLAGYAGAALEDMRRHEHEEWEAVERLRDAAGTRLGLTA
ncbi:MAG TPA: hypothetical protein VF574_01370 [Allosphingosinicella sp.]|jgi:hypothetical protein